MSNDPVGISTHYNDVQVVRGFNRYAYVNNIPYKYIDLNGENAYLVSRAVDVVLLASHNYVVHDAQCVGDPNGKVRSFGNNGSDVLAEVDDTTRGMSKTISAGDKAYWARLAKDKAAAKRNAVLLGTGKEHDDMAKTYADAFIAEKAYKIILVKDGTANSNTAGQAIADKFVRKK